MIKYVLERIYFLLVYSFLIQGEFTTAITKFEMIEQYLLVCGCFLLKMILCIAQEPQQQMKSVSHLRWQESSRLITAQLYSPCLSVILKLLLDPGSIKKLIRRRFVNSLSSISQWLERVWFICFTGQRNCNEMSNICLLNHFTLRDESQFTNGIFYCLL